LNSFTDGLTVLIDIYTPSFSSTQDSYLYLQY